MPPRHMPSTMLETGEGFGQGSTDKVVKSLTKALEGMVGMMEQQTTMMQQQQNFMTDIMGQEKR